MTAIYRSFWQWFADNSDRCVGMLTQAYHEPLLTPAEFETVFRQHCGNGLYADLEWNQPDSLPRIIISTHGDYHYFAQVEAMVAAAPLTLPWEVVAFEPPRKADHLIRELFGRLAFDPTDLVFLPLEMYNNYHGIPPVLTVYADIPRPASKKYRRAVEQVIYNVLGEQSAIRDISGIVVERFSSLTEEQEIATAPIDLLPEFVMDFSPAVLGVDEGGRLCYVE